MAPARFSSTTGRPPRSVRSPELVPRVGLGIWRMAAPGRPSRADAIATIRAAYEAGVRVFDTADSYGLDEDDHGYGERLVADALAGVDDATVITKGGWARPQGTWELRGDPRWLERAIEASAERLAVEEIDCYLLHGVDPRFDIAESLAPLVRAYEAGRVRTIGVSNVSADQLARACDEAPVSVVQNRLSVTVRPLGWREVVDTCRERDLWYLPHTPFGPTPEEGGTDHRVADDPTVREIAAARGVTPAVVALAWLLALAPRAMVIPGARRPESILDSFRAATFRLGDDELAELTAVGHAAV
jgi:aryl-alcohol dehydrogenase-like predicted oxidoreductase